MRRIVFLLLFGFMLTTSLAGCGPKERIENSISSSDIAKQEGISAKAEEQKKLRGKITVATVMTNTSDNKLDKLVKEFMSANPYTSIEIEGVKDYDNMMMIRLAAAELPDISIIVDSKVSKSNYPKYFLPLDDLGFSKDNILFYDSGIGEDNKLYGLSDSVSYLGVTYNKKAFANAGISSVPKSVKELYSVCEKLMAKGIVPLGTAFKDGWTLYPFENHEYWNASFTGNPNSKSPYLDEDEIIDVVMLKGWNLLRDFNKKGYLEKDMISASWDQLLKDLAVGRTAMYYAHSWFPSQVISYGAKKEDVGMFPWPESKFTPADKGKMWAVAATSEYPELAKAFLKYMMEHGRYAKEYDMVPAYKGAEVINPAVRELLSYSLPIVETRPNKADLSNAINEAEIDLQNVGNMYIITKDYDTAVKVVQTTNGKWAKIRKKYGGK